MTLKAMLLFRAVMTKRGEKGTITVDRTVSRFEPIQLDRPLPKG